MPLTLPPDRAPTEPILAARGITKRFPGVLALDHVDFEVQAGDVHAVLGQNGAGKTTLMNILFGLVQPDEGALYLRGQRVQFRSPHDAIAQGIGMVHQTRRLVAAHTVLENIVLGHPRVRGFLNLRGARREVEALCHRYGFTVDLARLNLDVHVVEGEYPGEALRDAPGREDGFRGSSVRGQRQRHVGAPPGAVRKG